MNRFLVISLIVPTFTLCFAARAQDATGSTPDSAPVEPVTEPAPPEAAPTPDAAPPDAPPETVDPGPVPFEPVPALQEYVAVTTKITQPIFQTPASVAVISAEQIERMGYRSVAEAVAGVPGLYMSYDLANHHVAVRGAFGGARAASRLLKIMIDGVAVPVSYSETYLLGPEFIPMSAIERIEILRGPASSIYGTGALAGAINVVTKRAPYEGEITPGARLILRGGAPGEIAGGVDGTASVTGEGFHVMAGVSSTYEDRSGYVFPTGALRKLQTAQDPQPFPIANLSENDTTTPTSALLKADVNLAGGRLFGLGVAQVQNTSAEFHDLATLNHLTRMSQVNGRAAVGYERPFGSGITARTRLTAGGGSTLPGDQIALNGQQFFTKRDFGSVVANGLAEGQYDWDKGFVLVGVDASWQTERLPSYTDVDIKTGQQTPRIDLDNDGLADPAPEQQILNGAVYGQFLYSPFSWLSATAALRGDVHSVYGPQWGGRVGLVMPLFERIGIKLLGGVAYKAPSPEQLFTIPVGALDVIGDPNIKAQYLYGTELAVDGYITEWLGFGSSVFYNFYDNALAYVAVGDRLLPRNYSATNYGGEASMKVALDLPWSSSFYGAGGVSYSQMLTGESNFGGFVEKDVPDNENVPVLSGSANASVSLPEIYLRTIVDYRYVGERVPSQSNLRVAGVADLTELDPELVLAPYHLLDLGIGSVPISLGDKLRISAMVKMKNVLDAKYIEAGFNGVDAPSIGRTVWLTLDGSY